MMYCRARSIQKHQPTEHKESTISELHANKVFKGLHMITVQVTKAYSLTLIILCMYVRPVEVHLL